MEAGLQALETAPPIFVDIKMVQAGVLKTGHHSLIECFIGQGDCTGQERVGGITRTSARSPGFAGEASGSIVVIGNAPSALLTLCDLIESGKALPRLVIGVPWALSMPQRAKSG